VRVIDEMALNVGINELFDNMKLVRSVVERSGSQELESFCNK
jgi:hypothetical protein